MPATPVSDLLHLNPTAGTGHLDRWNTNLTGNPVVYPNRAAVDRKLLTYTSAPLPRATTVTGLGRVTLTVTGIKGARHGTLYAYLEDVQPSGRVVYVTEGELALADRAVTALAARVPADPRPRHYLAGRLDGVQITAVIDGQDELLVTLTASDGQATGSPFAGIFRITAHDCSLNRVKRWHHEHTPLRAYRSHDGAIMLADPALGGNAPCEPPVTVTWHTHTPAISQDRPPPHDT